MEQFLTLNLDEIAEDERNPRKTFQGLGDLKASVEKHGILTPLLVRKNGEGYVIVSGARRFRVAKELRLQSIPVIVKDMTQEQALEMMLVDNLQREDIPPMEEAEYMGLLRLTHSAEDIAEILGKPLLYVAERIALNDAVPEARKMLKECPELIAHVLELVKLPPAAQKLFVTQHIDWNQPIKSFKDRIRRVILNLKDAPFSISGIYRDERGKTITTCNECPKLLGAGEHDNLFGFKGTLCPDEGCYGNKCKALANERLDRLRIAATKDSERPVMVTTDFYSSDPEILASEKWVRAGKKCSLVRTAVVVHASNVNDLGKEFKICIDKKCPEHRKERAEKTKYQTAEAEERKKQREERSTRIAMLKLLLAESKVSKMDAEEIAWARAYHYIINRMSKDALWLFAKLLGAEKDSTFLKLKEQKKRFQFNVKKFVDEELARREVLTYDAIIQLLAAEWLRYEDEQFFGLMKAFGITEADAKKLRKQEAKAIQEERDKRKAEKKAVKEAAKKKKELEKVQKKQADKLIKGKR